MTEKRTDSVVLEVGGVGYGILVSSEDFGTLKQGEEARVYVYDHLRENTHELFGFCRHESQELFELLLQVNGVGPKMALSILSIGNSEQVRQAIASGDIAFIQQASGVGKRLAERIVVDLKDKVGLVSVDLEHIGLLQGEATLLHDEAAQALVSLGYSARDAMLALQAIDNSLSTEERVRLALKGVNV